MCGIAGWLSTQLIPPEEINTLRKMMRSINHRGPDGSGTAVTSHACLGHVRLSIIDLENGQQPMYSHDRRFVITFNGEIYNYVDLRNQLMSLGHTFNTHSDTEVILELYRRYGSNGFSRLRGMYAFALWDNEDMCALLVRDPMGIKPFFLQQTADGQIVFASEAKAIIAKSASTPVLEPAHLHLLMNFRYIPGNASLFKGIDQLPPGTIIRWQPGKTLNISNIEVPEDTKGTTLDILRESVHLHMTSDVEIGCYLSGGIDSATIATLGKEKSNNIMQTFTINVGDDPMEAVNAAETAAHLGLLNTEFSLENIVAQDFHEILWHLEVPKINAVQNWFLARFTSQHVKVVLSGLGGDELFLGYNIHKFISHLHSVSKFLTPKLASIFGTGLNTILRSFDRPSWSESERSSLILRDLYNWSKVYGLIRNVWDTPQLRTNIYGERMLDNKLPDAFDYLARHWPESSDPVIASAKFEWDNKLLNDLLWQEDRLSMAHGLEVRTPYVDRHMYNHVRKIPRTALMHRGHPKAYMKHMLSDILPPNILNRPKSGFQVASYEFFHKHLSLLAREQLDEKTMRENGLFNYNFVKHVLSFKPTKRLRWHYFILYFMILSQMWVQIFESNKVTEKP